MSDGAINYTGNSELSELAYREDAKNTKLDVFGTFGLGPTNYRMGIAAFQTMSQISMTMDEFWNKFPKSQAIADWNENGWGMNRVFFKNNTGKELKVKIGGNFFALKDGHAYACHPNEWLLFYEQCKNSKFGHGGTLDLVDFGTWWDDGDDDMTGMGFVFLF
jgi:hypothetical protein